MSGPLIEPEKPDELAQETRAFWREVGKDLVRSSVETLDNTARQIIAVAGILEGLYFHGIAFTDLAGQPLSTFEWIVYLAPILILLLSLGGALLVFFPDHYKINILSSEDSRNAHKAIVASKLTLIRRAAITLVLGVAAIFLAVALYLKRG